MVHRGYIEKLKYRTIEISVASLGVGHKEVVNGETNLYYLQSEHEMYRA